MEATRKTQAEWLIADTADAAHPRPLDVP